MTVAEFYAAHLHYSVALRLFEDTCRQLRDCGGTVEERQALVDETLRLAVCVSDRIDEVEDMAPGILEGLQESGEDPSLAEAIPLIINQAAEDRRRVESYTKFITSRRIGQFDRMPRRPKVANPFLFIVDGEEEDDDVGQVTIRQEDPDGHGEEPSDEGDGEDDDGGEGDSDDGSEDPGEEDGEEASPEESEGDSDGDEEEGSDDEDDEEEDPVDEAPEPSDPAPVKEGVNPLAEESRRLMSERSGTNAALLLDEVERIRMEGERVEIVGKVRDRHPSYRPVRRR